MNQTATSKMTGAKSNQTENKGEVEAQQED